MGSWDRILSSKTPFLASCTCHVVILHYTKNYDIKVMYIPKIYNHTSLYSPIVSGASVNPTLEVPSSAMLVLSIVGN
jgi:hypothetical protein